MALNFDALSGFADLMNSPAPAGVRELPVASVIPDPNQPRKSFDPVSLAELAASIAKHGVIQPVVVRQEGDHYMIISGERRWRASKQAGLKTVPVIVRGDLGAVAQMIENIQRDDLTAWEIYRWVSARIDAGDKKGGIADDLGKSNAWVSAYAAIDKMPGSFQEALQDGRGNDITALNLLWKIHKEDAELADRLIASGVDITRSAVNALADKLAQRAPALPSDSDPAPMLDKTGDEGDGDGKAPSAKKTPTPGADDSDDAGGQRPALPSPAGGELPVAIVVKYDGELFVVRYTHQKIGEDKEVLVMLVNDNGLTLYAPVGHLDLVSIKSMD